MADPPADAVDDASRALLAATGPQGEVGRFVRDPETGEEGLVLAVRGERAREVVHAAKPPRPTLVRRLLRSFASRTDAD